MPSSLTAAEADANKDRVVLFAAQVREREI